jgi:hypothetical protein
VLEHVQDCRNIEGFEDLKVSDQHLVRQVFADFEGEAKAKEGKMKKRSSKESPEEDKSSPRKRSRGVGDDDKKGHGLKKPASNKNRKKSHDDAVTEALLSDES